MFLIITGELLCSPMEKTLFILTTEIKMEKTCSKCGFEYPEFLFYRSNITGLQICANCIAKKKKENMLKLRFPKIDKPSVIEAKRRYNEKRKSKEKKDAILTKRI